MSNAASYLGDSTMVWINLDRSQDRRLHMTASVTPFFGQSERVTAIYGEDAVTRDECQTFVNEWRREHAGSEDRLVHTPPGERFQLRTQQANIAIKKSHVRALTAGLNITAGRDRFFVAEDDIAPRRELFNGVVPAPPEDAEVAIWSGGLPMAAVTTDDKLYESGRPFRWVSVQGKQCFNCLGAGLYEVTPKAAHAIIKAQHDHAMSFDHAWAFALENLRTYRMVPSLFAQLGTSIRNGKHRVPVLWRKAS